MKAVCKPRVFLQLLDCSAAQAVTFETTTRHDKGTPPTTGDARPVYTTVIFSLPSLYRYTQVYFDMFSSTYHLRSYQTCILLFQLYMILNISQGRN